MSQLVNSPNDTVFQPHDLEIQGEVNSAKAKKSPKATTTLIAGAVVIAVLYYGSSQLRFVASVAAIAALGYFTLFRKEEASGVGVIIEKKQDQFQTQLEKLQKESDFLDNLSGIKKYQWEQQKKLVEDLFAAPDTIPVLAINKAQNTLARLHDDYIKVLERTIENSKNRSIVQTQFYKFSERLNELINT